MSAICSGTTLTHVQTINRIMPLTTLSKKNTQAGKEVIKTLNRGGEIIITTTTKDNKAQDAELKQ